MSPELQIVVTFAVFLILLTCGVYGNVARFLVPLTASDKIVEEGLTLLERSLEEAMAG